MTDAFDPGTCRLAAEQRFGAAHADLLVKAGWHPGRRIPEIVLDRFADFLGHLHEHPSADPDATVWELVEPARDILREFGGLTVEVYRPPIVVNRMLDGTPVTIRGDWVPVRFYPHPEYVPATDAYETVPDDLGIPVSPIAYIGANIEQEILIAADGRILTSDTREYLGTFYCAPTFTDALPLILQLRPHGYPIWALDEDGLFHEQAILDIVFERTGLTTPDPWPAIQRAEQERLARRDSDAESERLS